MIKKIICISPAGAQVIFEGLALEIDRAPEMNGRQALFVDIRDHGRIPHGDGHPHFVAQVPTAWIIFPVREGDGVDANTK